MSNIKTFIFCLIIVTISTCYFIKISNDHIECSTEIIKITDKIGNEVLEKKHICREKYSF
jgi:hypothetical protein